MYHPFFGLTGTPQNVTAFFHRRTTPAGCALPIMDGKTIGSATGVYSLLVGFMISLICIVAFSLLTKKPSSEIEEEFERVKIGKEIS